MNLSQKTTEELVNEISSTEDIDEFISDNKPEFISLTLSDYLKSMLSKYNLSKGEVFKRAGMSENNYGYEIFSGNKENVSRDKLIQICFGFPLSCEEAQYVLRLGRLSPLYPRIKRDAYIMFALRNGYDLYKLNELLFEHGEKVIN